MTSPFSGQGSSNAATTTTTNIAETMMLKRISAALATLLLSVQLALAAGSISLSGAVQLDTQGQHMAGCLLYTFQSGTSTPQSAYQDTALTLAYPNPMECDASGRLPFFYLADGSIKIRLTNAAGVTQLTADGILVIGPSSGGGGGASVDATTVLAVGDVKAKYGTGSLTGFVRMNGRTIGSATSGASERANADTQTLFEYLWTNDANLAVSGGRGASANADWSANKTIALPDLRGRALLALDDMGASAAGRLTGSYWGGNGTTLGQSGGAESRTLLTANLPAYTPSGSVGITDPGHEHQLQAVNQSPNSAITANTSALAAGTMYRSAFPDINLHVDSIVSSTTGITAAFTGTAQGGTSTPFAIVPPAMLVTFYIKL
jgi:hypothetical protein